ncbi:MAG TPA: hypothetical protein VN048_19745 [Verrucomicrobiae bacterium]|jgi:hypothetical protein|nr:hypothetical protein [Verrucomicrobiae bacterium]
MNAGRTLQGGAGAGLTTLNPQPSTIHRLSGLSLIEILVTVTLLVVIILGLTAMFNQTRKAFTVGLGNVDYQDAGRTAMDLITRDLEQMVPTSYSTYPNAYPPAGNYLNAVNFYADISPAFATNVPWNMTSTDSTNFSMERLFFVTRYNQQWNAIGYRLLASDASAGVGTLYRYSTNNVAVSNLVTSGFTFANFFTEPPLPPPSFSRVVDGVVDFRIRAYDTNGLLIPTAFTPFNGGFIGNVNSNFLNSGIVPLPPGPSYLTTNIGYSLQSTGDYDYVFCNIAVPAYVEVELGIMESPTLARLQALTNSPTAYMQFLTSHAGQVHIFRQRITIPAVDSAAYP